MRKTFILVILCVMAMVIVTSCKSGNDASQEIPVKFAVANQSETSTISRSNGDKCDITVNLSVKYPQSIKDKASTESLQKAFIEKVLEGNVNLPIEDAVKAFALSVVSESSNNANEKASEEKKDEASEDEEEESSESDEEEDSDDESDATDEEASFCSKVLITIKVDVVYQQNNVLSMCKETTVQKDGVPSKTHEYYNFDLVTLKPIDLKIFRNDAIGDLCKMLKEQLMSQNDVSSADELSDLGYFNIDNLTVTTNFYFTDKGLTWSYLPQELAADAKEEPTITLEYSDLNDYTPDNSVLKRF